MKTLIEIISEKLILKKQNKNVFSILCNSKDKQEFTESINNILNESTKIDNYKSLDTIYSNDNIKQDLLSKFNKDDMIIGLSKHSKPSDNYYIIHIFNPFKSKSELSLTISFSIKDNSPKLDITISYIYGRDKYGAYFQPNLEGLDYYKFNKGIYDQYVTFVNDIFDDDINEYKHINIDICPYLDKKLNINNDKNKIIKRLL